MSLSLSVQLDTSMIGHRQQGPGIKMASSAALQMSGEFNEARLEPKRAPDQHPELAPFASVNNTTLTSCPLLPRFISTSIYPYFILDKVYSSFYIPYYPTTVPETPRLASDFLVQGS